MKSLLLFVFLFLILIGCDQNGLPGIGEKEQGVSLEGNWQLTQQKIGYGPPGEWEPVQEGAIIEFKGNQFKGLSYHSCSEGTFQLDESELTLNFGCDEASSFTYEVEISNNRITLSPRTLLCFEGCEYKYVKIN